MKKTTKEKGLTIVELTIVLVVIGILVTIAAVGWSSFERRNRLRVATNQVYNSLRRSQSEAKRDKTDWQTTLAQDGRRIKVAIHPSSIPPVKVNSWEYLPRGVKLDFEPNEYGQRESSLLFLDPETNRNTTRQTGYYTLRWNFQGCPIYKPGDSCGETSLRTMGRIALTNGNDRSCVVVSTLLGVLRKGQNHDQPDRTWRHCY